MCRIIAAHAYNRKGLRTLQKLIVLLEKAARYDPLMPSEKKQHCDGYGYVLIYRKSVCSGWSLKYEKFDAIIQGDTQDPCLKNLEALEETIINISTLLGRIGEAYILLHTRKASPKTPRGTIHAHPYHVSFIDNSGDQVDLFLAHNGYVNRDSLSNILGYNTMPEVTDSYLATLYLAQGLKKGKDIVELLDEIGSYTVTAFAAGALLLRGNNAPQLYYANKVVKNPEYYSLRMIYADGINAVVSPTIVYYLNSMKDNDIYGNIAQSIGALQ